VNGPQQQLQLEKIIIRNKERNSFPALRLDLLYSAFTYYTGFKVNSGEYKLMGLAPYGNPIYENKVKKLLDIKEDGTFRLDQKYFNLRYWSLL
jgi:predicted NodU family carbamoyl transferase